MNIEDLAKYKCINIIGSPGSGKSTAAKVISEKLNYKYIDLDELLYIDNCIRKSHKEDIESVKAVTLFNKIVIDGTYSSSLRERIDLIDVFILTRTSRIKCIYRFFKRLVLSKKLKCGERLTFKTFSLLIN